MIDIAQSQRALPSTIDPAGPAPASGTTTTPRLITTTGKRVANPSVAVRVEAGPEGKYAGAPGAPGNDYN